MTNEVTVPLLPCPSIDDIITFYGVLGFHTTYKQRKPYPCVGLQREDLHLQFFEIAGFDPEQSYGSCIVLTSDIAELHRAFAAGMRAAYGKVLVSGMPRMTRPRARKNADGLGGFSIIDPGGNWIRVFQNAATIPTPAPAPTGRLGKALANAVVLADSKGDVGQAVRILDSALARPRDDDDPVTHVEVLVYRAELAMALHDRETATEMLARAKQIALNADETARAAPTFEIAADLAAAVDTAGSSRRPFGGPRGPHLGSLGMRVTHSLLHADDLAQLVAREYAIAAPVKVSLLNRGFNDTYLVTDVEGDRRVLRVYNRDKYWIRSESDLRFELDLLEHLAAAGLGVIRPYQRTAGDRLGRLAAPEGERCFALFTYAPGTPSYEGTLTAEQWREFGSGIARMHLEMDAFQTSHDRYHLDERILVERPLASLAPYAESGQAAADLAELGKLGERLTDEIHRLRAITGAYGIIHADLHRGNTNISDDGRFVTFDFDHCGFGLRAYDLVSLYRGPDSPDEERERWAAALAGYQQVRPLSPAEVDGFPALAACRAMWDIGDWLGAADRTGDAWVTEGRIARLLADVRKAT